MRIVWRQSTRNHHVGELDGQAIVSVVRPQKHRHDGTPHDWQIEVLGSRLYDKTFCQHDPRDLESTKTAAEARTKWAIECLYKALHSSETCGPCEDSECRVHPQTRRSVSPKMSTG